MQKDGVQEAELRQAIRLAVESGYHLDSEAFSFLKKVQTPSKVVSKALIKARTLPKETFVLTADFLRGVIEEGLIKEERVKVEASTVKATVVEVPKTVPMIHATDIEPDVRILEGEEQEITPVSFLDYFRARFEELHAIIQRRFDVQGAPPVTDALTTLEDEVKMIGMVRVKRTRENRVYFVLEDLKGGVPVLAPREMAEIASQILPDQVICTIARRWKEMFIAQEIIWPDIPDTEPNRANVPVFTALLSDLHIGSSMFAERAFNRFIEWLKGGYGNATLREIAHAIKYVVINGDLVDGVGIYPGQEDELLHRSFQEQYEKAASYIEQIPEHITVIISAGDHDATNKALPHMPISREYAKAVYECRDLIAVGSPALISLHGVKILVYHGEGLDDIVATVPGHGYNVIGEAIKLLLRCRHLSPIYGKETGIIPLPRDPLIIRERPDVFQTGHVHVFSSGRYHQTIALNSGSWQHQTVFQRRKGVEPTVGLAPIVNLQTLNVVSLNFLKGF